jgi:hypothetical protein
MLLKKVIDGIIQAKMWIKSDYAVKIDFVPYKILIG